VATLRAHMRPQDDHDPPAAGPPDGGEDGGASSSPPLGPLPSGRHRFSPEQVARHQRERLIAGLAAEVAERGYAAVTIGQIAAAAHVSRRVFYEHFETKEECFGAAFDVVFEHLRRLMTDAAASHRGDWPRQLSAALGAALDFLSGQPDLARLCLVESPSAGPELQRRFGEVAEILGPYVRAGRQARGASRKLPDSTELSLVGAVGARLNREIALHGAERLPALLPGLVEFVLAPYLGIEEARRYAAEAAAKGEGETQ
jgi:AcrR family transcriptional regulator